jgi:uncharacterized protein YycO
MNPPKGPAILLFRGRGLASALIRFQSRGEYSHAAILMPDGRIVESWQGAGVRVKTLSDWKDIDAFTIPNMPQAAWDDAIRFALDQVGKGYDYVGVARFITRKRHYTDIDKWFCSELVFAALQSVGFAPFDRIEPWAVSPGLLLVSPMLFPITHEQQNPQTLAYSKK